MRDGQLAGHIGEPLYQNQNRYPTAGLSTLERKGNAVDYSKTAGDCEKHFYTFYYKNRDDCAPDVKEVAIKERNVAPTENILDQNEEREIEYERLKERAKKAEEAGAAPHQTTLKDLLGEESKEGAATTNNTPVVRNNTKQSQVKEFIGYMPKRKEFEHEFDNEAELILHDMEFFDNETEDDR